MTQNTVIIRTLHLEDYQTVWEDMRQFTKERDDDTLDELWLLEHPAVFTQGQNGKAEHVLAPGNIPVIQVDRGGQVTYHGPGQLVVYTLVDIQRKKFNVRQMVNLLEKSIIDLLQFYKIPSEAKCEAPGIYIDHQKICSIGLRISRGKSFHGLALNVAMDLEPFTRIHPCGFSELKMTQMQAYYPDINIPEVKSKLIGYLMANLGYNENLILAEKWYDTKNSA